MTTLKDFNSKCQTKTNYKIDFTFSMIKID